MGPLRVRFNAQPDLFYSQDDGLLLMKSQVKAGSELVPTPLPLKVEHLLPLDLYELHNDGVLCGYRIVPHVKFKTIGTGALIYYNSWMHTRPRLEPGEVVLSLKLPCMYAYSAVNKITVLTTPELSDPLHDYLTML